MISKIVTIGAYGFEAESFFQALVNHHVDVFCDIRLRRGMRGSKYAFANHRKLVERLDEFGIAYFHFKELAPSNEIRKIQKNADQLAGMQKRYRPELSPGFIDAYKQECLRTFNSEEFSLKLKAYNVAALFCVEKSPEACHRSIVADYIKGDLGIPVEHIKP